MFLHHCDCLQVRKSVQVFLEVIALGKQLKAEAVLVVHSLPGEGLRGDNGENLDVHLVFADEAGEGGHDARE